MSKIKAFLTVLLLIITLLSYAQNAENRTYNLITGSNTLGIGYSNILDPYLSPFEYKGQHLIYNTANQRFLTRKDTLLSRVHRFSFLLGNGKHPTNINSMLFFGGNYDFGIHYHWQPSHDLTFLFGGSVDIGLGGKYIARNVNNPFSMDLYTNLNASLSVNYKFDVNFFNWFRQDFRVEYSARTPLIGGMFVPRQGISYYELFSLKNVADAFHFTSIHNQRTILHYLNLDIPTRLTTFRIGLLQYNTQYRANDLVYHRNNFSVNLGWVFDFYVFEGSRNKPPKNFRSTY